MFILIAGAQKYKHAILSDILMSYMLRVNVRLID